MSVCEYEVYVGNTSVVVRRFKDVRWSATPNCDSRALGLEIKMLLSIKTPPEANDNDVEFQADDGVITGCEPNGKTYCN